MPKNWGKQIFTHGRFPEVGQKQKTEEKTKKNERKTDNSQLRIATPRRVAHAKPPGPICICIVFFYLECTDLQFSLPL